MIKGWGSMGRKLLIIFFSIAVLTGLYSFFSDIFHKTDAKVERTSDILIEDSYQNFAWGFQYNGVAICADGSIYSFDMESKVYPQRPPENLKEYSEYILKNARLENARVSDKDLGKMLNYIPQIDPKRQTEPKSGGNDMGLHSIVIYDYVNDSKISLKTKGDWSSKNTSLHAIGLVRLTEKYTNKVRLENAMKQKLARIEHEGKWKSDVLKLYDTKMPLYADLRSLGLGRWVYYHDKNGTPCILRIINGKIEKLYQRGGFEGFTYLDDTDPCNVYDVDGLLFIEQEAKGTYALNMSVISKDDVKAGKYDFYAFNLSEDGSNNTINNDGENFTYGKIKYFPKVRMTVGEFREKISGNKL